MEKEVIYEGPIFKVEKRKLVHPITEAVLHRDIVVHDDVVVILVELPNKKFLLTKEYRAGVDKTTIGLPAGFIDAGEYPFQAAIREVAEETGYIIQPHQLHLVGVSNSSEGFTDEKAYLYYAKLKNDLFNETNFDKDEYVETEVVTETALMELVYNNKIQSAQVLTLILLAKLKGYILREKIGVVVGKFYPFHQGHQLVVTEALKASDEVYIVLSHHQEVDDELFKESNLKEPITLEEKVNSIKEVYKENPKVKVVVVDETNIPRYPNGWNAWSNLVTATLQQAKQKSNIDKGFQVDNTEPFKYEDVTFYSSEPQDKEGYEAHFDGAEVKLVDITRGTEPISGTLIRSNPEKYLEEVPEATKNLLKTKI